jgi:hypothetical protein
MKFAQIVIIILLLALTAISGYAVNSAIALKKAEIRNNAVDGCGKIASTVKSGEFIRFIYDFCLVDKDQK